MTFITLLRLNLGVRVGVWTESCKGKTISTPLCLSVPAIFPVPHSWWNNLVQRHSVLYYTVWYSTHVQVGTKPLCANTVFVLYLFATVHNNRVPLCDNTVWYSALL